MVDDDERETIHGSAIAHVAGPQLDDVIAAIRDHERRVSAAAFETGFRAGWEQATKAFEEAFSKLTGTKGIPFKMELEVGNVSVVKDDIDPSLLRGKSISDQIMTFISLRPGFRGIEIVNGLNKSGVSILERTTRTVLWRLKNAGRIKVVDGRWYASESAPSEPLSQKEEADNAAAR